MTPTESSPGSESESEYLPIWESMLTDFGHPDLLVRAVDEEIISYLAAHPEAQH
jgi:hypothetical protein